MKENDKLNFNGGKRRVRRGGEGGRETKVPGRLVRISSTSGSVCRAWQNYTVPHFMLWRKGRGGLEETSTSHTVV